MASSIPTKRERLLEFFRRLAQAPAASNFDEAYRQLCDTLNAVEDEMTGIPYCPDNWMTDGRMYPPQFDKMTMVAGRPDLRRFRTVADQIFIADNGAMEFQDLRGNVRFSKPGASGGSI